MKPVATHIRQSICSFLLLLFTVLSAATEINAQVIAGEIPSGASSSDPLINFVVNSTNPFAQHFLDLDCNGSNDICLKFMWGYPPADGTSFLFLIVLDSSFSFCEKATWGPYSRAQFYAAGDTMNCMGANTWNSDSLIVADYGGFNFQGPETAVDTFLAYSKQISPGNVVHGWIKLSFDMSGVNSQNFDLTASIQQIVSYCTIGISEINSKAKFTIFPNPSNKRVSIFSKTSIDKLELISSQGIVLKSKTEFLDEIELPDAIGFYFIKAIFKDGEMQLQKVLKQ